MYFATFLHIYQPPTQKEIWVRRISDESYRKIFTGLLKIPRARLTLNINGILCELLERYGGEDILEHIRTLLRRGALELTGSAYYHAFLPLLPEHEIERQIVLNEDALRAYFGDDWKKSGFFSPEMAYSEKVARIAAKLGYRWIIADELGFPEGRRPAADTAYRIKGIDDVAVFFRERNLSFTILSAQVGTAPAVLRYLGSHIAPDEYVLVAMDGETFGHHRPGLETLLFDLMREPGLEPATISALHDRIKKVEIIIPRDSTWAVTKKNMTEGKPFARWNDEENAIQRMQWELTALAIEVGNRAPLDPASRRLLDGALHSDQYWWASAKPWWSLEMIERGAYELRAVVQQSPHASEEERERAEELYRGIVVTGFDWQRSGLVDTLSRQEDEEIMERLEEKEKMFITAEEYRKLIGTLRDQMHLAANAEEYHRAAMIKDRVRELEEEMRAQGS